MTRPSSPRLRPTRPAAMARQARRPDRAAVEAERAFRASRVYRRYRPSGVRRAVRTLRRAIGDAPAREQLVALLILVLAISLVV